MLTCEGDAFEQLLHSTKAASNSSAPWWSLSFLYLVIWWSTESAIVRYINGKT
jgi:hypothetical protein